jgi:hypothetical protein
MTRKGLSKLKTATLDRHLDETLRRVRAEFERSGEIHSVFECVTDAESFDVPAHWPNHSAKAAACAALRDSFRRRGVNRYLFASEAWAPDDPDRGDRVQVIAVERSGPRRYAFAETATLFADPRITPNPFRKMEQRPTKSQVSDALINRED